MFGKAIAVHLRPPPTSPKGRRREGKNFVTSSVRFKLIKLLIESTCLLISITDCGFARLSI